MVSYAVNLLVFTMARERKLVGFGLFRCEEEEKRHQRTVVEDMKAEEEKRD
jgi:hypothetical protein